MNWMCIGLAIFSILLSSSSDAQNAMNQAQLPHEDQSMVSIHLGWGYTPQPILFSKKEAVTWKTLGLPALSFPLLYKIDESWGILIDVGYTPQLFGVLPRQTVVTHTFPVLLGGEYVLRNSQGSWEVFLTAGIGVVPAIIQSAKESGERPSAYFGGIGVRWAVTQEWGIEVRDRFVYSVASLDSLGQMWLGGNMVSVGVFFRWAQTRDRRHF